VDLRIQAFHIVKRCIVMDIKSLLWPSLWQCILYSYRCPPNWTEWRIWPRQIWVCCNQQCGYTLFCPCQSICQR